MLMMVEMTAQYLFRQVYSLKGGETVLNHAAAGGVGLGPANGHVDAAGPLDGLPRASSACSGAAPPRFAARRRCWRRLPRCQRIRARSARACSPWCAYRCRRPARWSSEFAVAFVPLAAINGTGWPPAVVAQCGSDLSRWCLVAAIAGIGVKTAAQGVGRRGPEAGAVDAR
jgi:hypothetical protein